MYLLTLLYFICMNFTIICSQKRTDQYNPVYLRFSNDQYKQTFVKKRNKTIQNNLYVSK